MADSPSQSPAPLQMPLSFAGKFSAEQLSDGQPSKVEAEIGGTAVLDFPLLGEFVAEWKLTGNTEDGITGSGFVLDMAATLPRGCEYEFPTSILDATREYRAATTGTRLENAVPTDRPHVDGGAKTPR